MNTIRYRDYDCVSLENASLRLLVTRSVGPRVIALRYRGGENLFAELPDFIAERPDGRRYHFYGGHRLWHAPEAMPRTYVPDDAPVDIAPHKGGLLARPPLEVETGIQKALHIVLADDRPHITLRHTLTNHNPWAISCAPWAITQLRPGGVAILPQSQAETGFLPNRSLALWPYTNLASPHVTWGNRYLLVHAEMKAPFKVGFPNPRGWLAYWLDGILFVKRAPFDAAATYCDFGCSSECYCNDRFLELETLAPLTTLSPGQSITHTETWEVYGDVPLPADEEAAQAIVDALRLEEQ